MNLQTFLPLSPAKNKIDYESQILLLGSCFVENMGDRLGYYKYQILQNPFGILFHIFGIENLIDRAIHNATFAKEELAYNDDRWFSFDAHSRINSSNEEEIISCLNQALVRTNLQIQNSSHIIITLGTSWVFREKSTNKMVANCHKFPSTHFTKEILSIEELKGSLQRTIALIRGVNKTATIIFTISPVRHIKNGIVANQRSKAHLIAALGEVLETNLEQGLHYFPSYELVMDELRDYRFYAKDMIHLNELGVEYIWEKFKYVWLSEKTTNTMKEVDSIQKAISHRPFDELSKKHQLFVSSFKEKIRAIKKEYPFMTFDQ
jgi:hypothetical protein